MQVQIRNVRGHYEVYAADGSFLFSADTHREVMEEVGLKVKDLRYYRCQPWGISGNIMMGYWCRLDGDDDTIHLDNFELADGAWVSREELRENYTGNGIALTSEMIAEFAAGRDPYSLGEKQVKKEKRLPLSRQPLFHMKPIDSRRHVVPLRELAELSRPRTRTACTGPTS